MDGTPPRALYDLSISVSGAGRAFWARLSRGGGGSGGMECLLSFQKLRVYSRRPDVCMRNIWETVQTAANIVLNGTQSGANHIPFLTHLSLLIPDGDPENRFPIKQMKSKDGSQGKSYGSHIFIPLEPSTMPGPRQQRQWPSPTHNGPHYVPGTC